MEPSVPYESQKNLFAVQVLTIFGKKLLVCLLYTIIYKISGDIVLSKNQHPGEMKPLSSNDGPLKLSAVNEVTYAINSDHADALWMPPYSSPTNQCKTCSN